MMSRRRSFGRSAGTRGRARRRHLLILQEKNKQEWAFVIEKTSVFNEVGETAGNSSIVNGFILCNHHVHRGRLPLGVQSNS